MSLQNAVAQYTINISREGNGAIEANQELTALNSTLEKSAASAARASSGYHELHSASQLTKVGIHELHAASSLFASHLSEELTAGLTSVQVGMHGVSLASKVTGIGVGTLGAAFASLAATMTVVVYARKQIDAAMALNTGGPSTGSVQGALKAQIALLVEEGKMAKETAASISALLNPSGNADKDRANNFWVMNALRAVQGTNTEEEAAKKLAEIHKAMLEDGLDTISKEKFAAGAAYDERIKQIDELRVKAGTRYSEERAESDKELAKEAYNYSLAAIDAKQAEEEKRKAKEQTAADAKTINEEIAQYEKALTIQSLTLSTDRVTQANREYAARTSYYSNLYSLGAITNEKLDQLNQDATLKRLQLLKKEEDSLKLHVKTIKEMEADAAQSFSTGIAQAFTAIATGSKSAADAFRDFAIQFASKVAEMIIETEVLAAVKNIAGLASGGVVFTGGSATPAGGSGSSVLYAASGLAGVSSVSRATYLPRFNVVAGEAGREMLTVLARPRMMELGGVQAVVGQAGRNTLAITSASDLAGSAPRAAWSGGQIHIRISHSEDAKAEIISSSIKGAVLSVTKEAQQSGPLRKALKTVTK